MHFTMVLNRENSCLGPLTGILIQTKKYNRARYYYCLPNWRFLLWLSTRQMRTPSYIQLAGWSLRPWNSLHTTEFGLRELDSATSGLAPQTAIPDPPAAEPQGVGTYINLLRTEVIHFLFVLTLHVKSLTYYKHWKIIKRKVKILTFLLLFNHQNWAL